MVHNIAIHLSRLHILIAFALTAYGLHAMSPALQQERHGCQVGV
jgi:hypothetical protein